MPHAVIEGLAALTGAEARLPLFSPPLVPVVLLPLAWVVGAQLFVPAPFPRTLALTPHTVTEGFAAFTGAGTVLPPLEEPLPVVPAELVLP